MKSQEKSFKNFFDITEYRNRRSQLATDDFSEYTRRLNTLIDVLFYEFSNNL